MDIAAELKAKNIDAQIFMLVHDSIVIHCKDEYVDEVLEIMRKHTQKDRGCSIPGFPIGIDQEVHDDYSFGKFEKRYAVNDEGYLIKLEEKKAA
jgi:hypothetical protein